jgi:hypothetical protein
MNIIKWLQQKELDFLRAKQPKPQVYPGFAKAENFGILLEANSGQEKTAKLLWDELEKAGKKVWQLKYYHAKQILPTAEGSSLSLSRRPANWLGRPTGEGLAYFIKQPYAAIFDLTDSQTFALECVRAQTICDFYIGFGETSKGHTSLQIDASAKTQAPKATAEALKYLKLINEKVYG